jgi:hypothetical protein
MAAALRLVPQLALPARAYVPGIGAPRPALPIAQALAAGGAGEGGFSPVLFCYGADLLRAGFCWEAHECWEVLWRREGVGSPRRPLLQGLILLAAAGVKSRQGRLRGAARLQGRGLLLLERGLAAGGEIPGWDAAGLLALAEAALDGPKPAPTTAVPPPR